MRTLNHLRLIVFGLVICAWAGNPCRGQESGFRVPELEPLSASRYLKPGVLLGLLDQADVLIDSENELSERTERALTLGIDYRHEHCIPALLAVIRNEHEPHSLRQTCVRALSAINDPQVIDHLIELIPKGLIGRQSNHQLVLVTGVSFGVIDPPQPDIYGASASEIQDKWRSWWKENRGRILLRSYYAFHSYPSDLISSKRD